MSSDPINGQSDSEQHPDSHRADAASAVGHSEHFKPTGTIYLLGIFVVVLILMWISVYLILLSRGVTT